MLVRILRQLIFLLVWLASIFGCALPAYAEKTLVITSLEEPINIRPYLEIIPDPEWKYDSKDILSGKLDHLWQTAPAKGPLLAANFDHQRLWFRLRVDNRTDESTLTWHEAHATAAFYFYALASNSEHTDWTFSRNWSQFNSYEPRNPDSFPSWRLNSIPWLSYSPPIKMKNQQTLIIGQAYSNPGAALNPHWQWLSPAATQRVLMQRTLSSITTIAAVAILSLYYLVVFLRLRLMPCLWINIYGALGVLVLMTFDKSIWIFDAWLSSANVWRSANSVLFLASFAYLGFIASALDIPRHSKRFRQGFRLWVLLNMVNWGYFILTHSPMSYVVLQTSLFITFFIAFWLLYNAVVRRIEGARLLIFGSLVAQIGLGLYTPALYGFYEPNAVTEWSIHIVAVVELFCFSLVLSGYTHRAMQERNTLESELQAKNQFFASITHELRTPLTAILGYSDSSLTQDLSKTELEANSKIIERSGKHLLELVNNNLDMSKIEAGKMELNPIETDMASLIHEIQQCFNVLVTTKGLTFNVSIQGQIPNRVTLDSMRLKQILMNLCSNAIKFTERGSVSIRIAWLEYTQQYQFIVEDTGIGLSEEQCNRLFRAYVQGDKSTANQYGGTGLGLNLSKKLAELMQGDIRVESEPNKGSRFIVCIKPESVDRNSFIDNLALQSEQPCYLSTETNTQFTGKILIAESDENVRNELKHFIQSAGLNVDCAENGKLAMSAFFANEDYDLIITGIHLDKMDGIELAHRIKNETPMLPIIAITSDKDMKKNLFYKEKNFNAFINSPSNKEELLAQLTQYLPILDSAPEILTEGPLRVLLAEDNLDNQKLIPVFLKKAGVDEVVVAGDGGQAINLARASNFDLVLMDIHMPETDGLTATRLLRKMDYRRRIYALTADESESCINNAKAAGCNGHLNKPIEFENLLRLIQGIKEEKVRAQREFEGDDNSQSHHLKHSSNRAT